MVEKHTKQGPERPLPPPPVPSAAPDLLAWRHVNRVQLAELIGVHPDTVTAWMKLGMPVIDRGGPRREGVYDAVACMGWWRAHEGSDQKEVAQTRAYNATAELNELKLSVQRGELVSLVETVLAGQAYTKAWAAQVQSLPARLLQLGLVTREQLPAVRAICRDILTEISSWKTVAGAVSVIVDDGEAA